MNVALSMVAALLAASTSHASVSRATAEWVQANAAKLDGEEHFLSVAFVSPGRLSGDFQEYTASTFDDGRWGGSITVVVLTAESDKFFRRFGADVEYAANGTIRTRSLSGLIVITRNGYPILDYTDGRFLSTIRRGAIEQDPTETNPHIRLWTDINGRTIEAEYLSQGPLTVTFRRTTDGQEFDYRIDQLSQRDRDWLAGQQ